MLDAFLSIGRRGFERIGAILGKGFASNLNPLHQLGALTIFFFWIVLISGIWLFVFFRTSVDGAYESVEYLTHEQWWAGGVMRSLHRYASDAAVVTLVLHIAREWAFGHHRGKRWFSWVTGIPLLWIIIPLGITGYWLVWDKLAQYVALTSAEMIDWIPIFTDSMARNFLSADALSDRFFTLMAFLHLIGLPLFLVFGIWLHVFRISRPRINPPRPLMIGCVLVMLLLSLVYPALSQGKADLAVVPQSLSLDWYYLLLYPLMSSWSPAALWLLLAGLSLLLFAAPWLPPAKTPAVAVVDLDNCNGCQRCVDDCPYGAVMMQPRTDGTKYDSEAVVDPSLCVSCGICVGACPTATPFRKASALSPGIDLPDLTAAMIRHKVESASALLQGNQRVMVFTCQGSKASAHLQDSSTAVVELQCMAHLPPPFVDFILSRSMADGVILAGCADGGCEYRLGAEWTRQRIKRERDPYLRRRIDERRVALAWADEWSQSSTPALLLPALRKQIAQLSESGSIVEAPVKSRGKWMKRLPVQGIAYGLFAVAASAFSAWPAFEQIRSDQSVISLTFSHAGQRLEPCRRLTQEELNKLPPNMRNPSNCPRERRPVSVTFMLDGETLYEVSKQPSGIWNDGESTIYARLTVTSGTHRLFIGMTDSGSQSGFDYQSSSEVDLVPGQHLVVEFDDTNQAFVFQ